MFTCEKLKNACVYILCLIMFSSVFFSCKTTEVKSDFEGEKAIPVIEVEPEVELEDVRETLLDEKDDVPFTVSFAMDLKDSLEKNSIEETLDLFQKMPAEYKDDFDLQYLHASLLFSSGKLEDASKLVSALQLDNIDNKDLQLLEALILKEDGKEYESRKVLEHILQKDPYDVAANVEMANYFMGAKNYSVANKYFKQGLKDSPKDPTALFGHAVTSWYLRDDEVAKKALEDLLEVDPENSMAWSYMAKFRADGGNFQEAVNCMLKATSYADDYYFHWLDLGSYYCKLNMFDEAEHAWSRAIALDSDYFLAYANRGGMRDELDDYDGALSDYNNVVRCNPDYYFAYESIGMLYWREKDWQSSRNAFLKAYSVNPQNTSYPLMISASYLKEGKILENKEFLQSAMKYVDKNTLDYQMLRLYYDGIGDSAVLGKVANEENATLRGRMLYYMALFYEIKDLNNIATKYYLEVVDMQAPMFFEYRLCEWVIDEKKNN